MTGERLSSLKVLEEGIRDYFLPAVAAILYAASFASAHRFVDEDSLVVLSAGVYGESLSLREYIDEQIDLALREYVDDAFEDIVARHTGKKIKEEKATWKRRLDDAKNKLRPAVQKEKDARKAADKDKNNKALKDAHRKAKNELDTIRGSKEAAEERLEYWNSQRPSPGA